MSTDLREALHRLAEGRAVGRPPPDLWRRGVRRTSRRRAGAAAAAVLAVIVGASGLLVRPPGTRDLQPAGRAGRAAIPSVVGTPSIWTPGTSDAGPPGRLALVAGAERAHGWFGTAPGLVGVSATTGQYRFLDLPGLPDLPEYTDAMGGPAAEVALAPHGGSLAYWTGRPDRLDGVAVYDTETGRVRRLPLPSRLGVEGWGLWWASDDAVVLGYGRVTRGDAGAVSSTLVGTFVWRPGRDGRPRQLAGRTAPVEAVTPSGGGFLAIVGSTLRSFHADGSPGPVTRVLGVGEHQGADVSPEGEVLVQVGSSLEAGPASGPGPVQVVRIPRSVRVQALLAGWRDARHAVVAGHVSPARVGAYAVDVRTGEARRIVRLDREPYGTPYPVFASALWSSPVADRPRPPHVTDPRLVPLGVAALALVALRVGVVVGRRRRALR